MTTSATVNMSSNLHVAHGSTNCVGAIGEDAHLDGGRQGRGQLRQDTLDPVGHGNDVGAGLALDVDDDCGSGVPPGGLAHILHIVGDGGYIGQAHRRSILEGNDQWGVVGARK